MIGQPADEATREIGALMTELVQALSTDRQDVLVLARRDENCVLVQVTAGEEQLGRLIGRNGSNVSALRRIMTAVASKYSVRVDINIGAFAAAGEAGKS